ncbi:MAG: M48 family metalloprotease [Pseudobdellovibrionaceae bacterium]
MRNPTKVPFSEFSIFPFTLSRVSLKVWFFLAALSVVILFLGYRLSGRFGLWVGFLSASLLVLLVYFFAEPPLLEKFRARKLEGQDAWNLRELAQKYARLAGVAVPDLYLMENTTPIAFSMGNHPLVCFSTELLRKLTPTEVEAVMAHQVCHLRNFSSFSFSVSYVISNALVGLASVMDFGWPGNWTRRQGWQRPFLTLLAPLAGLILRIAHSDRNYFENDDLAASFIADRKALASALWKLESYCQAQPLDIPACTTHLFIVNPEGLKESNWFFVTHPKMQSRLTRLVGTYPL